MSDPFVAEIRIFAGNFAPRGWAFCNGQLLPISQNTALFSLLGTTYGGDGRTNFGLPDLQGKVPLHPGEGSGLSKRDLGESGGEANATADASHVPAHTHDVFTAQSTGSLSNPANAAWGDTKGRRIGQAYNNDTAQLQGMINSAIVSAGGPHYNLQPYLAVNFIIALQGIFPAR
jgi:microcystin-dependent protein